MPQPPTVDVVIEIARGSFLKRGSAGHIDFVSPLPCPYNYGSVPTYIGLEGDLLDAIVLGPRLALGTELRIKAWGAVMRATERALALGQMPWILLGVHSAVFDVGTRDLDLDEALGLNCAWYADILLTLTEG